MLRQRLLRELQLAQKERQAKAAEVRRLREEAERLKTLRTMRERVRTPQERRLARLKRLLEARRRRRRMRGPSAFLERDPKSGEYRFSDHQRRRLRRFLRKQLLRAKIGRKRRTGVDALPHYLAGTAGLLLLGCGGAFSLIVLAFQRVRGVMPFLECVPLCAFD